MKDIFVSFTGSREFLRDVRLNFLLEKPPSGWMSNESLGAVFSMV